MAYLALYRKFRPQTFDKVIGQEHITTTLVNQIKSGKIGHAYLFCGSRGTGKTTTAKIFARAINCLNPQNGSPCGKCENCLSLSQNNSPDIFEIDAASNNKVENVREIRDKIMYPPVVGKYKVYIIDEVHMLTGEAFNALLKTLEEPPEHAVFILATTEVYKIPQTILSRCMRFDFRLVDNGELIKLVGGIFDEIGRSYEDDAVKFIAKSGEGCVRDTLSVAEICASFTDEKITLSEVLEVMGATDDYKVLELLEDIFTSNGGKALTMIDTLLTLGKSVGMIFKDLIEGVRELIFVSTSDAKFLHLTNDRLEVFKKICSYTQTNAMLRVMEILSYAEGEIRYSSQPRIILERAVLKASLKETDYSLEGLTVRIAELEKAIAGGVIKKPEIVTPKVEKKEVKVETITEEPPVMEEMPVWVDEPNFMPEIEPIAKPEVNKKKVEEVIKKVEQMPVADKLEEGFSSSTTNTDNQSDKKIWGSIIRALRRESITLYAICSERIAKVQGNDLYVYADSEGDYLILNREDNKSMLAKCAKNFGIDRVVIAEKSAQALEKEKVEEQVQDIVNIFGKNKVEEN